MNISANFTYGLICVLLFLIPILLVYFKVKHTEKDYIMYQCKTIIYAIIAFLTFVSLAWAENMPQIHLDIFLCIISILESVSSHREYKNVYKDKNVLQSVEKKISVSVFVKKCTKSEVEEICELLSQYDIKAIVKLRAELAFEIARREVGEMILSYLAVVVAILGVCLSLNKDRISEHVICWIVIGMVIFIILAVMVACWIVRKSSFCKSISYVDSYICHKKKKKRIRDFK